MRRHTVLRLFAGIGFGIFLTSCAVTEDALKASSETLHNTSEASSDVTSSTSHKDGDKKSSGAKEFSQNNLQRLRENMAVGKGPYLASLADLLDIYSDKRAAFYQLTKDQFPLLFTSVSTSATEMLAKLEDQLGQHPELRKQ